MRQHVDNVCMDKAHCNFYKQNTYRFDRTTTPLRSNLKPVVTAQARART